MSGIRELRLPALEIRQTPARRIYSFAVDGKELPSFAAVSRIHRSNETIAGYQRPEVLAHVEEIRRYLESSSPMMPNSLVLAFDERVRFEPLGTPTSVAYSAVGTLIIPVDALWNDQDKPGWVVDGQQRAAAIREARIGTFPVSIVAFIAENMAEQRSQFILVNSTKPLPKGLIYELLPGTEGRLPSHLLRRRFPTTLLERLNHDTNSPLRGTILTPTNPIGLIRDSSILKMLEHSLSNGALYRHRNPETGEGDIEKMLQLLHAFWRAVSVVFPEAWNEPPRRSRLMHGAGIVAMGLIMDEIAGEHERGRVLSAEQFAAELRLLKPVCAWTSGFWKFGPTIQRTWNEIQNTPKDVQLLANHLVSQYRALVLSRPDPDSRLASAN